MKVYSYRVISEKDKDRWVHIIKGKTLVIMKNGIELSFNDDEIMEILKVLGINNEDFRRGY